MSRQIPPFPLIPNFTNEEFACKCGICRGGMMTADLLVALRDLRRRWDNPIRIVSGFRCPQWNAVQGGAKESAHMRGIAVDLAGDGIHSVDFIVFAIHAGFTAIGEGEYVNDNGVKIVKLHLDVRARADDEKPLSWTYTSRGMVPGNALVDKAWRTMKGEER